MRPKTYNKAPIEDRLWEQIASDVPDGECWLWTGHLTSGGYGRVWAGGRLVPPHRLVWQGAHGVTAPRGFDICHTCDNRACCNPAHLFLGTRTDNISDMISKGRAWWQNPVKMAEHRARMAERHVKKKAIGRSDSSWRTCDVCGRLISPRDFDNGRATRRLVSSDTHHSAEDYETLCPNHIASKLASIEGAGQ